MKYIIRYRHNAHEKWWKTIPLDYPGFRDMLHALILNQVENIFEFQVIKIPNTANTIIEETVKC